VVGGKRGFSLGADPVIANEEQGKVISEDQGAVHDMNEWNDKENDIQVHDGNNTTNKIKEAGEVAAGAGCFLIGCLGQTAMGGVILVIQLMVGLLVLGFIARIFGCN
jgi:hypothetical protein